MPEGLIGPVRQQGLVRACPMQAPLVQKQVQLLLSRKVQKAWEAAGQLVQLQERG